jgi:hypothetical protein
MIWVALKMVYTVEKNDFVEVPHPMFIHVQTNSFFSFGSIKYGYTNDLQTSCLKILKLMLTKFRWMQIMPRSQ